MTQTELERLRNENAALRRSNEYLSLAMSHARAKSVAFMELYAACPEPAPAEKQREIGTWLMQSLSEATQLHGNLPFPDHTDPKRRTDLSP